MKHTFEIDTYNINEKVYYYSTFTSLQIQQGVSFPSYIHLLHKNMYHKQSLKQQTQHFRTLLYVV